MNGSCRRERESDRDGGRDIKNESGSDGGRKRDRLRWRAALVCVWTLDD